MTNAKSAEYIQDILDMSEPLESNEKSEIVEFFDQGNVLITGGTGFLGKLIVEKLLRSCPNISRLYLVVRAKKGKDTKERLEENFNDVVFDRLKREQPKFFNKVILVEGDASKPEFGWSPETKQMLTNTNIIFHGAALVRFDEKLRIITDVNVKTVKFLLTFAKQLPNLKAFVHISTAFAHCVRDTIEEKHYKDSIDADNLIMLTESMNDNRIAKITPTLLDKWPNTYVFTKAVGENIILKYSNDLPVCIVRPAIVISTFKDPIAGWTNNLYGATGVVVGSGLGLLHTLHCISENVADIIPADIVVSTIISCAWDVATRKNAMKAVKDSDVPPEEKIPIYNSVSSCQNPISWGKFMKLNEIYGFPIPSKKVLWYYMLILNRSLLMHNICAFFFHLIPAIIVDTLARLTGRKPILLDAYRKIHKFSNVIHYFSTRQWNFRNDNVVKLWQKMNSIDRKIFNFDMENLDWDQYFYLHVRGLRAYMVHDSFDNIEEAVIKYNRLRWLHYTIITITSLLMFYTIVSFVMYLWSFCPLAH